MKEILLFSLIILSLAGDITCQNTNCIPWFAGDGECDRSCMNTPCNFDSKGVGTSKQIFLLSDCQTTCLESCSIHQLGNSTCDSDCNIEECGWDLGDCAYCDEDCTKTLIDNGTCDSVCNTFQCASDDGACSLCSAGCYQDYINDGYCNQACFNSDCNYDGNDCLCSNENNNNTNNCLCAAGCTNAMQSDTSTCHTECDNKACNWQNGKCGFCNTDCFQNLLNDGNCDTQCNTADCDFDYGDCRCSDECASTDLGTCKNECFYPDCDYDPGCTQTGLAKANKWYQIMQASFDVYYDKQACISAGCDFDNVFDDGNCDASCNNLECLYDYDDCSSSCSDIPGCNICFESPAKCVQCDSSSGHKSYYSTCVGNCPPGYRLSNPASQNICVPAYLTTTMADPLTIYVKAGEPDGQDGTQATPLNSLIVALASAVSQDFSKIVLMDGPHTVKSQEYTRFGDIITAGSSGKSIEIVGFVSSDPQFSGEAAALAQPPMIQLQVKDKALLQSFEMLKMKNVIVNGKLSFSTSCTDSERFCDYCPNIDTVSATEAYDDRSNQLNPSTEPINECSSAKTIAFIYASSPDSSITMENVTFENMRQQYSSIISSTSGQITLTNVSFKNCMAATGVNQGAVISINCSGDNSQCYGDFVYLGGTVSLINNGYELSSKSQQQGFIYLSGVGNVTITNVVFEYNVVLCGADFYAANGNQCNSFIYIEKAYGEISISGGSFQRNYTTKNLITINQKQLSYAEYTITNDDYIQDFQQQHVFINTDFTKNASRLNLIDIQSQMNLINTKISGTFTSNLTSVDSMISVIHNQDPVGTEWEDGSLSIIYNGERGKYYVKARKLEFVNFTITDCHSTSSIIYIEQQAGVYFTTVNISNVGNTSLDLYANTIADSDSGPFQQGFQTFGGYIGETSDYDFGIACDSVIDILIAYDMYLDNFQLQDSTCDNKLPNFIINELEKSISVSNQSSFRNLSGPQSDHAALNVINNNTVDMNIDDVEFSLITNSMGYGGLYCANLNSLTVTDCTFWQLTAANTAGIAMSNVKILSIATTSFENLSTTESDGACISTFIPDYDGTRITINQQTSFIQCVSEIGKAGAILITKLTGSNNLALNINGITIEQSKAKTLGASIFISNTIRLATPSYISNSTFSQNKTEYQGNIILYFLEGILNINNNTFSENEGNGSGITAYFSQKTQALIIDSNIFEDNIGDAVIDLNGNGTLTQANTSNNTFERNNGICLQVSRITLIDYNTSFNQNETPIFAKEASTLELVLTSFLKNFSENRTAGIWVINQSLVRCNQCTFTGNSTKDSGGVLRVTENSQVAFKNSNFNENYAAQKASVGFFATNQQDCTFENCNFKKNTSGLSGTIFAVDSQLVLTYCIFDENESQTGTSGIDLSNTVLTLQTCEFLNSDQTQLYASSSTSITGSNCTFTSISGGNQAAVAHVINSNVDISKTTITDVWNEKKGGAFYIFNNSILELSEVTMSKAKAGDGGGCVYAYASSVSFYKVTCDQFTETGFFGDQLLQATIVQSTFSNGTESYYAGGIFLIESKQIAITQTTFYNNVNKDDVGGGIAIVSSTNIGGVNTSDQTAVITGCTFTSNDAKTQGGGIFSSSYAINVQDCIFTNNKAEEGAGIYINCTTCSSTIQNNTFTGNIASDAGGAIIYIGNEPTGLLDNNFSSNSASYGENLASYPTSIIFDTSSRRLSSITGVTPGQTMSPFYIKLSDSNNQVVNNNDYSKATLAVDSELNDEDCNIALSGTLTIEAENGVFAFDSVTIAAIPECTVYLTATVDITTVSGKLSIQVETVECVPGEYLSVNECQLCQEGDYSLDPKNPCAKCPTGVTCEGGAEMFPKSGYWRSGKLSDKIFACRFEDACIGQQDGQKSYTGECETGYQGNLCGTCADNYTQNSDRSCAECPAEGANEARLIFVMLGVILILVIMVR